jgi:hypothetical protein
VASDSSTACLDGYLRGAALALCRLAAEGSALRFFEERQREVLSSAMEELCASDPPTRARTLSDWRREAASVVSEGLSRLHPSWIDEALAGERTEVAEMARAAIIDGRRAFEGVGRDVARAAFGWLVPLCESRAGPLAEELCGRSDEALRTEIVRRGARAIGRSLAGAPPTLRARAMAAVGEPWAREIAAGSTERLTREERGAATALATGAAVSEDCDPRERLLLVGVAALRAELAADAPGSCLRVAGRLPAWLGRRLVEW